VQIFSQLARGKLAAIDKIVYYYEHDTSGITKRYTHNYANYSDDPVVKCRLWIGDYINKTRQSEKVKQAFYFYLLSERLYAYLRHNRRVTREEIYLFYKKYFLPCSYKHKMRFHHRMLFTAFYCSRPFGMLCRFVLDLLSARRS